MNVRHSVIREGAVGGAIGASVVALWYFVIDSIHGVPLHTPGLIAQMLFGAGQSDAGQFGTLALVTAVHFTVYMLVGVLLASLMHLALRDIAWRMGVLFALVMALVFFSGIAYMLGPISGEHIPFWVIFGGGLLAVASIGGYLWRVHPAMAQSFRDVALGDETESAPYTRPQ